MGESNSWLLSALEAACASLGHGSYFHVQSQPHCVSLCLSLIVTTLSLNSAGKSSPLTRPMGPGWAFPHIQQNLLISGSSAASHLQSSFCKEVTNILSVWRVERGHSEGPSLHHARSLSHSDSIGGVHRALLPCTEMGWWPWAKALFVWLFELWAKIVLSSVYLKQQLTNKQGFFSDHGFWQTCFL